MWLQVLDAADINDITVDSYLDATRESFAGSEHNLAGLWEWEEAAVTRSFAGCENVLVVGAGGGREMIALARKGFVVAGFDASADLVQACRDNLRAAGVDADIQLSPPGSVPSGEKIYDALLIGRGVYHHIPGRRNRIAFLTKCRKRIKAGAPVLLGDFVTRHPGRHRLSKLSRRMEPGDSIGSSFYHYFNRDEIASELEAAGIELIDYRPTGFPGANSSLAHVVARS